MTLLERCWSALDSARLAQTKTALRNFPQGGWFLALVLLVLQQIDHGFAHGFTDIHGDFSLATMVAVAAAALGHLINAASG